MLYTPGGTGTSRILYISQNESKINTLPSAMLSSIPMGVTPLRVCLVRCVYTVFTLPLHAYVLVLLYVYITYTCTHASV